MKTKIQIKSIFGAVIFEFEKENNTVRDTVIEAARQRANLRSANLRSANLRFADLSFADLSFADLSSANLRSADLRSADLSSANLRSADLSSANLRSANLSSANLRSANLRSANLRSANLRSANLRSAKNLPEVFINLCSRDMLFVFEHLKPELPFLRETLVAGKVNGTQYEGECACLIGTLAKAYGGVDKTCGAIPYYDKGLHNFGEQWFWNIREGDTPENSQFAAHALTLIDSVLGTKAETKKRGRPRKAA